MILTVPAADLSNRRLAEAFAGPAACGTVVMPVSEDDAALSGDTMDIDCFPHYSPRAAFSAKYAAGSIRLTSDAAPNVPSL